jgi:O-antigen ligase
MLIILALPILAFFSFDTLAILFDRIVGVKTDESALVRLASFEDGMSIFESYPFFGIGYNFLSVKMFALRGNSSVDSSVLATLINFGLVPTIGFCVFLFLKVRKFLRKANLFYKLGKIDKAEIFLIRTFLIYVIICVVFVSQFNNLIYYQYWIFPVIMIAEFFGQCIRKIETDTSNVNQPV